MTPRAGIGYDVHAFEPGRRLVLCGVDVPHTHGLVGHSDGDVATHALIDSVLGAAGFADIGAHFPADGVAAGADSVVMLAAVVARVRRAGYNVGNADVTIVAQAPRLASHRDAMRQRLSEALQAPVGHVSVKFTTADGVGALGRQEGIAALATVLLVPFQPDRGA